MGSWLIFILEVTPDSLLRVSMLNLPHYQESDALYTGHRTLVYRALRLGDRQPVIVKALRDPHPSFSELVAFRNQYTIAQRLDSPFVVRPLALERCGNGYALVMPDTGAVSLERYWQAAERDLGEVLDVAIQLAEALHLLASQQIIHKDIKPANILIHPETKQVQLIDFSIASLLPSEEQQSVSPAGLEGTLAYTSPEQTGRMNRGIDYRTDFYSLGVTLYELLTGVLPFDTRDPLELVHCHIARTPIAPVDRPAMLSAIIMKLMAKNTEDRYQSALGLRHDLERCRQSWQETGAIAEFKLGEQDTCDRFSIPDKLYGREAEVAALLAAFDRVAKGRSELVLVSGFSGIGKTAIINEVQKPIARQNGYFIKGKFGQFNRDIPLSAFVSAFRDLMAHLLSEPEAQLEAWRSAILDAVGKGGGVLIDVIPELERIIGRQPPVPKLTGSAAQNRFNRLFRKFVRVFARNDSPLTIFLDDLQWADSASLELLKRLMGRAQHLLILGAYRDNEVSPVHPMMLTVEELRNSGEIVSMLTLAPLNLAHITQLVAETLHCVPALARPLAELVERKTNGNPFFATQFLRSLYDEGHITFDADRQHWECDITAIQQLALTDDVLALMATRLGKLPDETQGLMQLAACVGSQFDLETLAIVSEQSPLEAAGVLWPALQEGVIRRIGQSYKFFHQAEAGAPGGDRVNSSYRFLHDRVQQAAYQQIADDEKLAVHLKIGRLLQSELTESECRERLFDIVGHLNLGRGAIAEAADRDALARDNFAAAQKAKQSTAYAAACNFAQVGLEMLGDDRWETQYPLSLDLQTLITEANYLSGRFDAMMDCAAEGLARAKTTIDKVGIYAAQINAMTAQDRMGDAVAIGTSALAELGVEFATEPDAALTERAIAEVESRLAAQPLEELPELAIATEPEPIAAMELFSFLLTPVFIVSPALFPLLCATLVSLSLQFGNTGASAIGYLGYGMVLATGQRDTERAYRLGKVALKLLDRLDATEYQALVQLYFCAFLQHRKEPIGAMQPRLVEAYRTGIETGEFLYAGYSINNYFYSCFLSGRCLDEWNTAIEPYRLTFSQLQQDSPVAYLRMNQQILHNLTVPTEEPDALIGEFYNAAEMLDHYRNNRELLGLGLVYVFRLMLACVFGCDDRGLKHVENAEPYLPAVAGFVPEPVFHFYAGLTHLRVASPLSDLSQPDLPQPDLLQPDLSQPDLSQSQTLERAERHIEILTGWAQHAPANHQHKVDLLIAERHRVLGRPYEAGDAYDRAIAGALENDFVHDAAIANERAAQFYLDWGKNKIAASYLQDAYYDYSRWGAIAKVVALERDYPDLLQPILQRPTPPVGDVFTTLSAVVTASSTQQTSRPSRSRLGQNLDLVSVLKASHALSSELQLDDLLCQLTEIVLQNSGGDRCALILPQGGARTSNPIWEVRAIATPQSITLQRDPLDARTDLPVQFIQYVKRTRKPLHIDGVDGIDSGDGVDSVDGAINGAINGAATLPIVDDYLDQHQPQSVLGLPLMHQNTLVGLIYVQNQHVRGVFTPERLTVLTFLGTQAAVALENAALYHHLEDYNQQLEVQVAERTQALQDNNVRLQDTLDRLQKTQSHLIQAEQMSALGKMVAGMAHEINNPNNFIHGNLPHARNYFRDLLQLVKLYEQPGVSRADIEAKREAIDLGFLEEDLNKLLSSMSSGSIRIREVVEGLRTFSGLGAADYKRCQIHDGINSTLLILESQLNAADRARSIQVIRDYGEIPKFYCYPRSLNQAFFNLLSNAIDALAGDRDLAEPTIIIKTSQPSDRTVKIEISDNGPGIPPSVLGKIFTPFFTTKDVGDGTGLGLAIAYQVVTDKHGGTIHCASELGRGATFTMELPTQPLTGNNPYGKPAPSAI